MFRAPCLCTNRNIINFPDLPLCKGKFSFGKLFSRFAQLHFNVRRNCSFSFLKSFCTRRSRFLFSWIKIYFIAFSVFPMWMFQDDTTAGFKWKFIPMLREHVLGFVHDWDEFVADAGIFESLKHFFVLTVKGWTFFAGFSAQSTWNAVLWCLFFMPDYFKMYLRL